MFRNRIQIMNNRNGLRKHESFKLFTFDVKRIQNNIAKKTDLITDFDNNFFFF